MTSKRGPVHDTTVKQVVIAKDTGPARKPRATKAEIAANDRELRVSVGASMKINMGNYENAEASLFLSGLSVGTTEEEMVAALETGKIGWKVLTDRLRVQVETFKKLEGINDDRNS